MGSERTVEIALDALVEHPGWTGPRVPAHAPDRWLWDGAPTFRDDSGMLWAWVVSYVPNPTNSPRLAGRWRLDVADAATAGVLFDLLRRLDPDGCWETTDEGNGRVGVLAGGFRRGLPLYDLYIAPTLGEAAARALVAVLGVPHAE